MPMVIALPAVSLRTIPKFHGIGQHINVNDFKLPMLTRICIKQDARFLYVEFNHDTLAAVTTTDI